MRYSYYIRVLLNYIILYPELIWRDEFLNNAHKAFEANGITRKEQKLVREIQELSTGGGSFGKAIIGELTLELKKRETDYIKEEKIDEDNYSK